ncbi:MAG: hypothetical protein OHK0046_08220 [Anaerolineae bacterium]
MDSVIHLYPDANAHEVMLISNDADAISAAVDAVKTMKSVQEVESVSFSAAPRMAPENYRDPDQNQGTFRYRLHIDNAVSFDDVFLNLLHDGIQEKLNTRGLHSEVVLNA